jgi:hypothetical protein
MNCYPTLHEAGFFVYPGKGSILADKPYSVIFV